MLIGDLVWLTQTMKSIVWAVHALAQHICKPGPAHVRAAMHLLRFVKHCRDMKLTCDASEAALTVGWDRRHKLIFDFDASLRTPGTRGTTGVNGRINGLTFFTMCRRQNSISSNSCEAETKASAAAAEAAKGFMDTLAELLERWPAAALLRGDCRASAKQMEKNTDRRNQAAYKKSLAYTSSSVNAGITVMDLIPREYNLGDNHTQQGHPFERWNTRNNTIMGVDPEVYVSETIREMIRFNRENAGN